MVFLFYYSESGYLCYHHSLFDQCCDFTIHQALALFPPALRHRVQEFVFSLLTFGAESVPPLLPYEFIMNCVCVFQCQSTALLRALGSAQYG